MGLEEEEEEGKEVDKGRVGSKVLGFDRPKFG
jgi:hypothetical protein